LTYIKLIKSYLQPKITTNPNRIYLQARSLPIIRVTRADLYFKTEWVKICNNILKRLEKIEESPLSDQISIDFVKKELEKP